MNRPEGGGMFKPRDFFLVFVVYCGIAAGIFFPDQGAIVSPLPPYLLMVVLFLSFLRIDFRTLTAITRKDCIEVGMWSITKLGIMPVVCWTAARMIVPSYALPVLLLSGISTGVVAPFISNLLDTDTTRAVQLVVVTSLLVPLTLPAWVEVLMGQEISISFTHMAQLLFLIVFTPMATVALGRRIVPGPLEQLNRLQYPVSVALFFTINLGVFASYSAFLRAHKGEVILALAIAFALAVLYSFVGLGVGRLGRGYVDGVTGAVSLTMVNSLLVIVFSARFFGPKAPLLAAMYMFPFFVMVIPLRMASLWASRPHRQHSSPRAGVAGW
jgi:BASS family bile acid:Na+ symporter